ncbi:permease [Streptococcus macacae]|uniref:Permease n=1 Tax=Streptococcus macacae NCTC 11558 TaxID=764298 RepID=G5JYL7_9STRE|nr:permease [Streptococcus macacae]EHJ53059.1 putative permease [Streptococcus macacae NCTC 11558]SUN78130.1 permease [Streptococcus macacae NCTC 11558]
MAIFNSLPNSVLQCLAIFLSIIIEALPFILLGAILSGFIEVYLTPDIVNKYLPKKKFPRILFGTFIGFIFPSCECGIIPIVNRFLEKKVPSYTAIPFLATAPIINPIVLFATYSAFGNSWRFVILRLVGAIIVALSLGILLGFIVNEDIIKKTAKPAHFHSYSDKKAYQKVFYALVHAVDELFDTGRYLVFGSLVAACMQIYIPTRVLTSIGHNPFTAILIMMLLAFILSLCSEADAFIGSSLLASFGLAPVMAFLLIGPMVDIKNLMMMRNAFTFKFIWQFVTTSSLIIIAYCLLVGVMG